MARSSARLFLMLLPFLVSGCAELQFISAAGTEVSQIEATPPSDPSRPDLGERYKVGDPYQINGVWYYPAEDDDYVEEGIASWYGPGFHGRQTANGAEFDENLVSAAHRTLPMPSMVRVTNLENGRSIRVIINDRGPFAHSRIIDMSRRGAQLLGFENQGTALVRVEFLAEESRQLAAIVSGETYVAATGGDSPMPEAAPTLAVDGEELAPPPGVSISSPPPEGPVVRTATADIERTPVETPQISEEVQQVPVDPVSSVFIQAGAFGQYHNANRARSLLSSYGPVVVEEITRSDVPLFRVRIGPFSSREEVEPLLVSVIEAGYSDAQIILD
ncbi:MAG: septal ring lytic transglycosylase RlpA family protein [Alphaproteobacteria bacterium]